MLYDYEYYKQYCKDYYGSVKDARYQLIEYTKVVQDFDKLCDDLCNYVNELSKIDYIQEIMNDVVDDFNFNNEEDLQELNINELEINKDNKINITEISKINFLYKELKNMFYIYAYDFDFEICSDENYLWLEKN